MWQNGWNGVWIHIKDIPIPLLKQLPVWGNIIFADSLTQGKLVICGDYCSAYSRNYLH